MEKLASIKSDDSRVGESEIISVPEACTFLGIHRNTLYRLIRSGEVPAFKMSSGGWWKFRRTDLEQWVEDKHSRSQL